MISFQTITYPQARATDSHKETKAAVLLRWIHAGHPATNLRMHSALRSLGTPSDVRPRNVADFRENFQPVRPHWPKKGERMTTEQTMAAIQKVYQKFLGKVFPR